MRNLRWAALSVAFVWAPSARAGDVVPNPYAPTGAPAVIDFSNGPVPTIHHDSGVRFQDLDAYRDLSPETLPEGQPGGAALPEGWVQQGDAVVPRAVAEGADVRNPAGAPWLGDAPRPAAGQVMGPNASTLCAFPDETPGGVYNGFYQRGSEFPRRGTIYMNYMGGKLVSGGENSAENQSTLALSGKTFPVYTGGEAKAVAVAQAVQIDFESMALRVLYLDRPPKLLPYVMIMMGGKYTDTTSGPAGGVAPSADCEDAGLRNVCYAFVNKSIATDQSNTASQEIGHTMGLGHTFGKDRVMAYGYDTTSNIDMGFGNECSKVLVAAGQGGYCAGVNKCHCGGDGEMQHDLRTLQAIYAPPGPDMVPPTISILAPEDGAQYAVGEIVVIKVEPWDDFGGYGWELVVSQGDKVLAEVVDYDISETFVLKGLPAGTYTMTARVQDQADQVGEDVITVVVGDVASSDTDAPTTSDSDGPTTDPSTSDTATGDTANSDTATGAASDGSGGSEGTADTGMEIGEDGCSCRDTTGAPPLSLLGLLALAGARRRRRSA